MSSIYDRLNEQQKMGVFTTEGPVLLLAGAGSGKTGVLTHRIAHLIEDKGVSGYNILAITFTNKAAAEMRQRVDDLVGFGAEAAWIMTFHAACVRILRRYIDRIGYLSNFTIYDSDDQKTVMKEVCKRLDIDTKVYKEKALLSEISNAKDNLISPDEMYQSSGGNYNTMKVAEVYREYQEQLLKNNALDFDDIINKTIELFEKDAEVLDYYQERFKYIMVDEYQDTNTAQFKLISLLAKKYNNICVVGDDDQSIYKFRGANIMNILNFEQYFPNAVTIKLEQNYRSTQNILNVANAVIKNNYGRKDKSLWTASEAGEKISFNHYENGIEEALGIAREIDVLSDEGYSYSDFAILYRTNAQSRIIEEKLLENNIPYRLFGGVNFYSRKEIKDILAYLKTIANGRDDLSVKRILNVPKRGIGQASINKVQVYADENNLSFYDALRNAADISSLGKTSTKIEPFTNMIQVFRSKLELYSIKKLIEDVIEQTEYFNYLEDTDEPDVVEERRQNLDELISKAALYEETENEPTLGGFLEEVALVADIDNLDENSNVVKLMTLHSAKGLEFPVVFLAGMEDGLFPSYMSISTGDESDIEEERRLCYVGITRARERLILSDARYRMIRGETQMNKTSRFVKEIPEEYLIKSGQSIGRISSIFSGYSNAPKTEIKKPVVQQSYQKQIMDANIFDKKTSGTLEYGIGDSVRHSKFGVGVVKDIKTGGRDFEVTVEFETAGIKKMFAAFAKLEKI